MALVDNLERLAHQAVVALPSSAGEIRPTRHREKTLDGEEMMTKLLEEACNPMDTDRDSLCVECVAMDPVVEGSQTSAD